MQHILVLGATGTFGKALTEQLIQEKDYQITLFSRHVKSVFTDTEQVRVLDGDALSLADLKKAMAGMNVVYCAISGGELPRIAENIVYAMKEKKVSRLIFMGAVGVYNEIPNEMDGEDNVENNPDQIPNQRAVEIIENSGLDYTILRPGYLRDGEAEDATLSVKGEPARGYISTIPSVVNLAVELIADQQLYLHESVSITRDMREAVQEWKTQSIVNKN